jgi:hypothetical protein
VNTLLRFFAVLACVAFGLTEISGTALGQTGTAPGQDVMPPAGTGPALMPGQLDRQESGVRAAGPEPSISDTTLTARGHQIPTGASAGNLEGTACPATHKMLSGACHPGYNDQVKIINQFPNISGNTWRCGFRNTAGSTTTAWVYTLCGR